VADPWRSPGAGWGPDMKSLGAILLSFLAAAGLSLCLLGIGARARRTARLPIGPRLELPVDFLFGCAVLSSAFVLSGLLGGFRPAFLLLITGALAAAGRYRGLVRKGLRLAPIAIPSLILLPIAAAPPFFHDALVYHLGLPWQALRDGRLLPHEENLFSSFPALFQMIAAGPLAVGCDRAPALLHLASFLLAGQALAALASRIGAPGPLATLCGATLPLLPSCVLVPALPAAEGFLIAALLAALAVAVEGRHDRGAPLLAGLLSGVGVSARLQGITWAAIVLAIVALGPPDERASGAMKRRPGPWSMPLRVALALLGLALASLPWWLKNLVLLGDPLAPLGWRREGIETLWRDSLSVLSSQSGGTWPGAPLAALMPHLSYLAPLLLASMMGLLTIRGRRRYAIAGAAALGLLAWSLTSILPRFLTPGLALLLALAAASGSARRPGLLAGALALGVTTALGVAFTAGQMGRLGGLSVATADPLAWPPSVVVHNPAPAFAQSVSLPRDARVLFIGETRGFGFPRRFVASSQHDVSPLREPLESSPSAEAARDWLIQAGFTHLLVNGGELNRLMGTHPIAPFRSETGRKKFQDLLALLGRPVIVAGDVAIFTLQGRDDAAR
jgi:hypothetical protein